MRISVYFPLLIFILLNYQQDSYAYDWQFDRIQIKSKHNGLEIFAGSIYIPGLMSVISNISYECHDSLRLYPIHKCHNSTIRFDFSGETYQMSGETVFDFNSNAYSLKLKNKDQNLQIIYNSKFADMIRISLQNMPYQDLAAMLKPFAELDSLPIQAEVSSQIILDWSKGLQLNGSYQIRHVSYENEGGNMVLADCAYDGDIDFAEGASDSKLNLKIRLLSGEALFQDIYMNFSEKNIEAQLQMITTLNFDPQLLNMDIHILDDVAIHLNTQNLEEFNITYNINELSVFYKTFLSSWFEILGLSDFRIEGKAEGSIMYDNQGFKSVNAQLQEVYLLSKKKKTEANNLSGHLSWNANDTVQPTIISWDSLLLAGMPINPYKLNLLLGGDYIEIPNQSEIPILDGSLEINTFKLENIFDSSLNIEFDGYLHPISLALITEKMGWPVMQGNISGKIPGMKKSGNKITFDGQLQLKVFDGDIKIDNLTLERLFGIAPVIAADVDFHGLNLQQITSTYDFGEITGLIKGYIKELRITNWKPDRLNAYIETDPEKSIKQYISQRAVDNISSIGGMQGAISRSFLRFFDRFKYKRLGIGCKLRNSVCEMSGLKNADNKYFLIEGKGLPAINIIGISKYIDWEIFLDRLLHANY